MTHAILEDVGGREHVAGVCSKLLLIAVKGGLCLLDGAAHLLVLRPIGCLVLAFTILHDFAPAAAEQLAFLVAYRAALS